MYIEKPFNPYGTAENQVFLDLTNANENFAELYYPFQYSAEYRWGTQFPGQPKPGMIFYNEQTGKLYRYNQNSWVEIDYKRYVLSSSDPVRFVDGFLEVQSGDGVWYRVRPLVGAINFVISTPLDNSSFTDRFYILPGTSVRFTSPVSYIPFPMLNGSYNGGFYIRSSAETSCYLYNGINYFVEDSFNPTFSYNGQLNDKVIFVVCVGFLDSGSVSLYPYKTYAEFTFYCGDVGNSFTVHSLNANHNQSSRPSYQFREIRALSFRKSAAFIGRFVTVANNALQVFDFFFRRNA